MADTTTWIAAVRTSHDRFVHLVQALSADEVERPSYAKDWSIAQTASHLGSQAEIFALALEAGLQQTPAPGPEQFGAIWARWDALPPAQQVHESVAANEAFVTQLEQTSPEDRERFSLFLFGRQQDLAGLLSMRLGEHALHTWDIAVALDASATVSAEAVELIVDQLAAIVGRSGKAATGSGPVDITTTAPERTFRLTLDPEVSLEPTAESAPDALVLPAEALVRLVYGRLDPEHTPAGLDEDRLAALRRSFPGF